jgi:hypothetical protein
VLLWILLLGFLLPASVAADAGMEAADCEEEAPLSRAAAELLLQDVQPTPEALMQAVRDAGSDIVGVRAYLFGASQDWRAWLTRFASAADAGVVCGRAQSASSRLLLVAARAGSLDPITKGGRRVRGHLAAGFSNPELVVADGDGELQRIAVDRESLSRGIEIAPELVLPARVQLLARGRLGPRPIAERVVRGGGGELASGGAAAAVDDIGADVPSGLTGATTARRLAGLRDAAGRPPLRDNAVLASVAAAHARDVCARGVIAHELVPGSDPKQRLEAAGVRARRVGETVARGQTGAAAFAAFEHSPSHRLTLLEPGFTDVGIGEAHDRHDRTCVVVLLAAWPRFVGR